MNAKMVMVAMVCCSGFLYGMESNQLNIVINGTTISLIKKDLYKLPLSEMALITAAGKLSQSEIQEPNLCGPFCIGEVEKEESAYVPDAKGPYGGREIKWPQDKKLFSVVEPYIWALKTGDKYDYYYYGKRRVPRQDDPYHFVDFEYKRGEAIPKAKEDLEECYKNLLSLVFAHGNHTIAFPAIAVVSCFKQKFVKTGLPAEIGAEVAVTSVINFFKDPANKGKYTSASFVISNDQDYSQYSTLINKFQRNPHELNTLKIEDVKK